MGRIFKSPKPKVVEIADNTANAEAESRKARLEAIARARRGRVGLIATSERGISENLAQAKAGKTLLGE